MILTSVQDPGAAHQAHPLFAAAFGFLQHAEALRVADGRHDIEGGAFALVSSIEGRGVEAARLEAHDRFIDIQCAVAGMDVVGWRPRGDCHLVVEPYNAEKDIAFYADAPLQWHLLLPGIAAIYFPEDAHEPLAGRGPVRKIVVKVPVER